MWRSTQSLIYKLEDLSLVSLTLAMLFMAIAQIILRNGFDSSWLWAENALRITVLWLALLGAMRATRAEGHISIDILQRYWRTGGAKFAEALVLVISAVICLLTAYHSQEIIQLEYEDATLAFLSVPVWFCQAMIPAALVIIALRLLSQAIGLLFNAKS